MSTMNVSLPDAMKDFIDEQVGQKGYGSSSEYIRDLVRREQDREKLRALILTGMNSPVAGVADKAYFEGLRQRGRAAAAAAAGPARKARARLAGRKPR